LKKMSPILLFICAFVFLLNGCSNTALQLPASAAESLILGQTVIYPTNEPPTITIVNNGKEHEISGIEDYPSKPQISPDARRLAYISPYEFEHIGEVWIYDARNESQKAVITKKDIPEERSASRIVWLDDRYLLVVIRYAYGTMPSPGDLYVYDTERQAFHLLVEVEARQDIDEILIDDKEVIINITTYDDQLTNKTTITKKYNRTTFYEMIKQLQ